jgi:hypothetical protein
MTPVHRNYGRQIYQGSHSCFFAAQMPGRLRIEIYISGRRRTIAESKMAGSGL